MIKLSYENILMDDKDIQENSIKKMNSNDITSDELKSLEEPGIFLTSVTCIGAIAGFSTTLASAKKFDPVSFNNGLIGSKELSKMETGASLALRALGWGTLYAVIGTTSLAYGLWKLSGASNMKEFREKIGKALPKIPKNDPPQGRTEFAGLTDLLTYLSNSK